MIEEATSKRDPAELDARRLSERLLFLNDVSMHTSAFTLQALLQNLAASDPNKGYIETLRHECETVLREADGQWTREAVQKLVLLDSTIRESMRMSPFSIFGLPRTVGLRNSLSTTLYRSPNLDSFYSNLAKSTDCRSAWSVDQ